MIYFFGNAAVRRGVCFVRTPLCVYASVREGTHYIFILVSRVFAGYLRQIVRLSGFAVPIFSKEVALACLLARRREGK